MVKFGLSMYSIRSKILSNEMSPEESVRWLVEQGAEFIEVAPFGFDLLSNPELTGRLKKAAGNVPIDTYSISANFLNLTEEQYDAEISHVKKHVDVGREMGVKYVCFECASYDRPANTNIIEQYREDIFKIMKIYQTICDYAADFGITILMENHGFHVNGCDRMRATLQGVKRQNFGHQLDAGNYALVDEIPEIAINKMLPFAKTIHVNDFYIRPCYFDPGEGWFKTAGGRHMHGSILGDGDINIPIILSKIKKSGYSGNIAIEYDDEQNCLYGTRVSLNNLKRLYASEK